MEEDDDFGDLYSDVLLPFQSPPPPPAAAAEEENILYGAPNPNPNLSSEASPRVCVKSEPPPINPDSASGSVIRWNLNLAPKPEHDPGVKTEEEAAPIQAVKKEIFDPIGGEPSGVGEDFNRFDIEEIGDLGSDNPMDLPMREKGEEGEDWDSDDSEDDLQIVLDDDKNHGLMGMGAGVEGGEEDDPMMILAGGEQGHVPMEEREWGEDGVQGGEGERKDAGDGTKAVGGAGMKIGFGNHAYHPYHSQFKYVRPGAAPIPGGAPAGPGGATGQVRPPLGPVAGRGRGEWRPPGMKGFHSGFAWGNNASGRGFGIGLDFTLPSHKTIFEVDVNSFEEKPWKLAGIDVSDFFNFGLNEESWKDYCKQLELLRMETSMQSKIRVYESARTEQDYDPDLPPELAAATIVKDISSENANAGKIDAGQNDLPKEFGNMRPSLPTGRPIQVETGSGERLPSIDTRPPRIRDSDAIIEIVLEGLEIDDPLPENVAIEQPEHDLAREGSEGGLQSEENFVKEINERFDGCQRPYSSRKRDDHTEGDGTKPLPQETQTQFSPNSRGQSSSYPGKDVGAVDEERRLKSRTRDRSPDNTRSGSTREKKEPGSQKEGSVESVGGRHSPHVPSLISGGSDEELDVEHVDDSHDDLSRVRKERASDASFPADACVDENPSASLKKQRGSSRVQHSSPRDFDDGGEVRVEKRAEYRKSRSGSERDHHKSRGNFEEDVVRHGRPKIPVNMKRSYDDDEHNAKPRSYDEKHEMGKHRLVETSREDPYSYRDWDPHGRKERDNTRKRELVEEIGSRHRNKVYENERMDKDEYFKLKKHMNNGGSRGYYDKDIGSQYRGRDDNMKNRFDAMDDPYRKRRKEDEYMRRDVEKEEAYLGRREYTNHRKRERDDVMDPRKREGQVRSRDEGNHSTRYKEDEWVLWERERNRDKQSHEDSLPKRERVDGRDGVRGGRAIDDKAWVEQARVKDKGLERDYHFKDMGRQSEQLKRRDTRAEDVTLSHHKGSEDGYAHGDQYTSDERVLKQERPSTRSDLENSRAHHKRHKENPRKSKESEGGEHNSMAFSKRSQEVRNGQIKEPVMAKRGRGENDIPKKYKVDATASSDEEQQDSRKGRSKLERWTSHQERDFNMTLKKPTSSLLAVKETERYNSNIEPALATKSPDENHLSSGDPKEIADSENKNGEPMSVDNNNNKHLDTVEKLKKRSERFKLPMPSEKEAVVIKKMESEPLPSAQDEAPLDLEIKPERPARKRRWIGS